MRASFNHHHHHHQHDDEMMSCLFQTNVGQKGRASFQLLKKAGQGVTKKGQGAAPCKNGLGRALAADYDWVNPRSLRTMSASDDFDKLA